MSKRIQEQRGMFLKGIDEGKKVGRREAFEIMQHFLNNLHKHEGIGQATQERVFHAILKEFEILTNTTEVE